jgi:hypothetical protein
MPYRHTLFRQQRFAAIRNRLVAVFLLGVALFMPPMLILFMKETRFAGIPVLYLYVFAAWIGLTALLALVTEKSGDD